MTQGRNARSTTSSASAAGGPPRTEPTRALSARSVVASTLLGVEPPRLPSRELVRAGELFGIAEGTTRVALSRMVAAGDLVVDDGWYALTGRLLDRSARQAEGRHPALRPWAGDWTIWVVEPARRSAADRGDLRAAMRALRVGELREGVWTRPDNLDPDRLPEPRRVVADQCRSFTARPDGDRLESGRQIVADVWDLEGWAAQAIELETAMAPILERLDGADLEALVPGFELGAAVLRHLIADPLLPDELLPDTWPGGRLRSTYEHFDSSFKRLWRGALVPASRRQAADPR